MEMPTEQPSLAGEHLGTPAELGQYPTPAWAAEALVREHLADLNRHDFVLEPTCGPGRFLAAIPNHVDALGVEIDPALADLARRLTGRPVITGDFLTVDIPARPSVVVGNPPFATAFIEQVLDKIHNLILPDGRLYFVLPAYFFQTAKRVTRYSEKWSLRQQILPRNIYDGLKHPLVFAEFRKDNLSQMVGFSLFHELDLLQELPKPLRDAVTAGPATWPAIVTTVIDELGGEAHLEQIYQGVANRRPTTNPAWKEQIRKVCRSHTHRVSRGRYATRRPDPEPVTP